MPGETQIHMRVSDERKRALRILAAQNDFPDLTAYILDVLATHTPMDEIAASLDKFSSLSNQNNSNQLLNERT